MEEAIAEVDSGAHEGRAALVLGREGWHPGVVGIVASRLRERFNRPACVIALADGIGRGSGRSVRGVELGAAVIAARQAGLLINGGGHAMAAGFTVAGDRLEAFRAFMVERVAAEIAAKGIRPALGIDGALTPRAASRELLATLAQAGPYGAGNPEPRFVLPAVRVVHADVVGNAHIRCAFSGDGGGRLKGIAFRALDGPLGKALLNARGGTLHIAGHLRADNWQGREGVQLVVEDAADPAPS